MAKRTNRKTRPPAKKRPPKKKPSPPIRTAADQTAIDAGCYWDDADFLHFKKWAGTYAIQSQGEWANKPMELLDFQTTDIFGPMLSWKKPNGEFRFDTSLIFSPKKIGKTTAIAALAGWRCSTWRDQSIFVIASKVEQAEVLFRTVAEFTRHRSIDKRWHVNHSKNIITDRSTGSTIRVLACNPSGISGYSADLFILDETAEMPSHYAQTIWDRIEFAGAAKRNSQIVSITTPAHDFAHLGYRLYQRACRLIDGEDTEDIGTLPVVYGVPTDADWRDPEVWKKHLPHIGQTVPLSFYETAIRRTKGDPHEELAMRIYLLGQYVRGTSVFVDFAAWSRCRVESMPDLNGSAAVLGLDNGGANDLLAITCLIPYVTNEGIERIAIRTRAAMTENALHKKNKTGQHHFQAWADKGLIDVISGQTITFERVVSLLDDFYDCYDVKALAYDPWQLSDLQSEFSKRRRLTIETPQFGKFLSPLIMGFERKIKEGTFAHDSDAVLDFCLENFQVKENRFGKLEFDKSDARSKIDVACSTVVALNALPEIGRSSEWTLPPVMTL